MRIIAYCKDCKKVNKLFGKYELTIKNNPSNIASNFMEVEVTHEDHNHLSTETARADSDAENNLSNTGNTCVNKCE